jgi:hypothetical protein
MDRNKLKIYTMKSSKILLGGIAGGIAFFLLGWLIYGVLLMDYTTTNYNQCAARPMAEMIWWAMILSNLALGFLIAIVFIWSNTNGVMAGAKVAGVLGLLMSVSYDFSIYSMSSMFPKLTAVFVDIFAYTFMTVITGIVVVLVMGMVKKEV